MTNTAFDLPHSEQKLKSHLPQDGDAVVVIRPDGSIGFFTLGMDADMIAAKTNAGLPLTDEELMNLDVANKAFALSVAAQSPMIMSILEDIASNPDIIDFDKIKALTRMN